MDSIITSPSEYRQELESAITRNYNKLVQARTIPDNQEDIDLYEGRMNVRLDGLIELMGVDCEAND